MRGGITQQALGLGRADALERARGRAPGPAGPDRRPPILLIEGLPQRKDGLRAPNGGERLDRQQIRRRSVRHDAASAP